MREVIFEATIFGQRIVHVNPGFLVLLLIRPLDLPFSGERKTEQQAVKNDTRNQKDDPKSSTCSKDNNSDSQKRGNRLNLSPISRYSSLYIDRLIKICGSRTLLTADIVQQVAAVRLPSRTIPFLPSFFMLLKWCLIRGSSLRPMDKGPGRASNGCANGLNATSKVKFRFPAFTTSLHSGTKTCASGLKQVTVAVAVSS
nr:hypothetical protein [Tanacetum cinerariifolium]